eukprot:TRINITY_DN43280_c0_g1_i1.p1 TRINITY_DN43280_c0_g1~~TRINITY_DN43280_c0_g1_i1.p1  ORF type:complete len:386 (-),score=24.29 TRINITY_DN43280_c0_g1_i1:39-1037(-)
MRIDGNVSDRLVFEPGEPLRGGLSKSLKGFLTSDFEFLVDQCVSRDTGISTEDLLVIAWRKIAQGWMPPSARPFYGLDAGINTRRIHLIMREQLAAKVTLLCHRTDIIATFVCLAKLKLLDYVAAERAIVFERVYLHESGRIISPDGSFQLGLHDRLDQMGGFDVGPRCHKLSKTVQFFAVDPSLAAFHSEADSILREVQSSAATSQRPVHAYKVRRGHFYQMCESVGFQALAVGFWWLLVLQLEPLRTLKSDRGIHFWGHTPWCLFEHHDYLGIVFGQIGLDLQTRAKVERLLICQHFEAFALAGERALEEGSFRGSFDIEIMAVALASTL